MYFQDVSEMKGYLTNVTKQVIITFEIVSHSHNMFFSVDIPKL